MRHTLLTTFLTLIFIVTPAQSESTSSANSDHKVRISLLFVDGDFVSEYSDVEVTLDMKRQGLTS